MEINLQGGVQIPQTLPGARSADSPAIKTTTTTTNASAHTAPQIPEVTADQRAAVDSQRLEQLQRAAQHFFKDVYAVSDTTFSIYKDQTGQYITRFTNLRDGKVTYIPEPQMMQYMHRNAPTRQSLVEIEA